ncbi:ATP-binding cassette domain-containing protein [uncultured Tateyamaria sp.]|uniref:ATP-binding cassette domain-containing protein n=1 Tax=uncultured Tateyamaria sp. TaxID=455651 RepID=UPI0026210851|nr:ATP-binding cassette domain-containing protein [uncultured Tateyamaria sp.]
MTLSVSGLSAMRSGQTILCPTSLAISPGDRIGLVGASGSGKSTLGHVLVDALRAQSHTVAHVPQSPDEALDPLRSMAFHWREAEQALGLQPGAADQKALFSSLKIEGGDLRKRPWAWSRGMQQRFVIAMALMRVPDLIVLDEPTSALDPVIAAATMGLLDRHLRGSKTAMMLITHDLGLVARRVSQLMVMHEGQIVEHASTKDILERPQSEPSKVLAAHRNWFALPC